MNIEVIKSEFWRILDIIWTPGHLNEIGTNRKHRGTVDFNEYVQFPPADQREDSAATMSSSTYCVGCGRAILDRYVLSAVPGLLQWHADCLRCDECRQLIDESSRTCFVRHRNVYCSTDFHRYRTSNSITPIRWGFVVDLFRTRAGFKRGPRGPGPEASHQQRASHQIK